MQAFEGEESEGNTAVEDSDSDHDSSSAAASEWQATSGRKVSLYCPPVVLTCFCIKMLSVCFKLSMMCSRSERRGVWSFKIFCICLFRIQNRTGMLTTRASAWLSLPATGQYKTCQKRSSNARGGTVWSSADTVAKAVKAGTA